MTTSPDDPAAPSVSRHTLPGQRWASASALLEAITDADYGVEDLVALTGADTPDWISALPVPPRWQSLTLPDTDVAVAPARVLARGSRAQGGWEATDTIEVYGYTGRPVFPDVLGSTARSLRDLHATDVTTGLLPVPATPGVAAERSTATVVVGGRRIWTQLTHFVAGADEPHAGRLIAHNLSVAAESRPRLAEDIGVLTRSVQAAFTARYTRAR